MTLGVPHRPDPKALVAGLLQQRCRTLDDVAARATVVTTGPLVIDASILRTLPAEIDLSRVVVDLDIDPNELSESTHAAYEAVRFHLRVDADTLNEATALQLPAPLVIFPELTGASVMESVTTIVEAHRTPGFDASASPRHIADILAVVAHAEVGFSARAHSGQEVLAILAATVAALRGDDILTALAHPNLAGLAALNPEAAEAVRTVLLGIEVDDAAAAHRSLVDAGLL